MSSGVFILRPTVIARVLCLLFSVIVLSCIVSKGWITLLGVEVCMFNADNNVCNFGIGISSVGIIVSVIFIIGEYLYERLGAAKKCYVKIDLVFSASYSIVQFVGACYLSNNAWMKTIRPTGTVFWGLKTKDMEYDSAVSSALKTTIAFSFLSVISWAACAVLAYIRFRSLISAHLTVGGNWQSR